MANRVHIVRPSSYTVQLRGVSGSTTNGITLNGTWQAGLGAFYFDVVTSGLYELWEDPLGGASYAQNTDWDDGNGKWVEGSNMITHIDGHGNASGKIEPDLPTALVPS